MRGNGDRDSWGYEPLPPISPYTIALCECVIDGIEGIKIHQNRTSEVCEKEQVLL